VAGTGRESRLTVLEARLHKSMEQGTAILKTLDVIAKIKSATSLKVEHKHANCAICHRRASDIVGIFAPRGESIPLCAEHLTEVEQALKDRLAELRRGCQV